LLVLEQVTEMTYVTYISQGNVLMRMLSPAHSLTAHRTLTASNPVEVANLLRAQANSASYPQWDGK